MKSPTSLLTSLGVSSITCQVNQDIDIDLHCHKRKPVKVPKTLVYNEFHLEPVVTSVCNG